MPWHLICSGCDRGQARLHPHRHPYRSLSHRPTARARRHGRGVWGAGLRDGSLCRAQGLAPQYSIGDLALRFAREAHNARSLNHAGCVRILDHGQTVGGLLYLAMDLLDGTTLRQHLNARAPMTVASSVRTAMGLLAALDHAHKRHVLHRDVKPENLMVTGDLEVTLIDFGLSQLRDDPPLTATGSCMGSPTYLAPERFKAQSYDERADLYAVCRDPVRVPCRATTVFGRSQPRWRLPTSRRNRRPSAARCRGSGHPSSAAASPNRPLIASPTRRPWPVRLHTLPASSADRRSRRRCPRTCFRPKSPLRFRIAFDSREIPRAPATLWRRVLRVLGG